MKRTYLFDPAGRRFVFRRLQISLLQAGWRFLSMVCLLLLWPGPCRAAGFTFREPQPAMIPPRTVRLLSYGAKGDVAAIDGSAFTVGGKVTNNSTIRLTSGAALSILGSFVNNGCWIS